MFKLTYIHMYADRYLNTYKDEYINTYIICKVLPVGNCDLLHWDVSSLIVYVGIHVLFRSYSNICTMHTPHPKKEKNERSDICRYIYTMERMEKTTWHQHSRIRCGKILSNWTTNPVWPEKIGSRQRSSCPKSKSRLSDLITGSNFWSVYLNWVQVPLLVILILRLCLKQKP